MQMTPPENQKAKDANSLKIFTGFVALTFAVVLAVITGNRLSDEALAVLAGAVCGVGAAIPTSLIIIAVARRKDKPEQPPQMYSQQQQGAYPPVIVVAPPGVQQQPYNWNGGYPPSLAPPAQRQFTVVGGTSSDMEAKSDERYF
jgi:hypothetical protein